MALRALSLCAGVGGLDLGCHAAFEHLGIGWRTAAYVEREAYAAAQLVALMEAQCLAAAPVWSDLLTFDARAWHGAVDCVIAGFPCQPHSVAGKRAGTSDDRWIWPAIVRIIRDSGAWLVVLENVRGLLSSGGMDAVLADLAGIGFAAEWGVLSASAVGASHRRERVFIVGILADRARRRLGIGRESSRCDGQSDGGDAELGHAHRAQRTFEALADAERVQPEQHARQRARPDETEGTRAASEFAGFGVSLADTELRDWQGLHLRSGRQGEAAVVVDGAGEGRALADGHRAGRRPSLAIVGRQRVLAEQGEVWIGECGRNAVGRPEFVGDELADASQPRPQGREQCRACDRNGGGEGNTWINCPTS